MVAPSHGLEVRPTLNTEESFHVCFLTVDTTWLAASPFWHLDFLFRADCPLKLWAPETLPLPCELPLLDVLSQQRERDLPRKDWASPWLSETRVDGKENRAKSRRNAETGFLMLRPILEQKQWSGAHKQISAGHSGSSTVCSSHWPCKRAGIDLRSHLILSLFCSANDLFPYCENSGQQPFSAKFHSWDQLN